MTSQYETKLWLTHVNIVQLAEPTRHCVRWWTQVFENRGVCLQAFPSFPFPSPLLHFLALISFLTRWKSSVFFLLQSQTETLFTQAIPCLKKVNPRNSSTFKRLFSKNMGKTPSSHIIHSLGGEYCWIDRDSKPVRLLKSPRSLSVFILPVIRLMWQVTL